MKLLLPTTESEWSRGLTASFVAITVSNRYGLFLKIVALFCFLAGDLGDWDPSLLAEVLAEFQGLGMLRHVARQAVGDNEQDTHGDPDDFVPPDADSECFSVQNSITARLLAPTSTPTALVGTERIDRVCASLPRLDGVIAIRQSGSCHAERGRLLREVAIVGVSRGGGGTSYMVTADAWRYLCSRTSVARSW